MLSEISVIVPVYKVEKYLDRCVDSLRNQTCQNIRIILVDDGSPDNCPGICDRYAKNDERIHVIHQKNRGLSAARNAGIDYVMTCTQSPYLMFLDSDDWLHPETLERMETANLRHGTSVCVCGFENTQGEQPVFDEEKLESSCWTPEEFYGAFYLNATIACGKLYGRDCFLEARFPEGKLNEDEFLTYRLLFTQEKISYIPAPFYAYYVNPHSITKSLWRPKRMDAFEAMEQQIVFFQEKKLEKLAGDCLYRYMRNAYGQMMEIRNGNLLEKYPDEYEFIREKARKLLVKCHHKGLVVYEKDFPVLKEFYPVRTQAWLYYLAACKRIGGILNLNHKKGVQ